VKGKGEHTMNKKINIVMLSTIMSLLLLLSITGCTRIAYNSRATDSSAIQGSQTEVWDLQITGDTFAQYKMLLNRNEIAKEIYSIDGEFSGMALDHIGGSGMVKCTFQGKITGHNLEADFIGTGDMMLSVHLSGRMWGSFSDTEGEGKYDLSHEFGSSYGKWSMKRIKTTQ
jgi:hypothetical protein